MINEILDEIRAVEAEAEEIAKKAEEDAKRTVFDADEEARRIRLETLKTVSRKVRRRKSGRDYCRRGKNRGKNRYANAGRQSGGIYKGKGERAICQSLICRK